MKLSQIKKMAKGLPAEPEQRDGETIRKLLLEMGYDPDNLYQELEMDSKYVDTHQDVSWSNAQMSLHSHPFYEILCCRNTCGVEYLLETERYRLQKGDIVIVPPGISHRPLLPETMPEPYRRDVLWVSMEFVRNLRQLYPEGSLQTWEDVHLLRTGGTGWLFLMDKFHQGVREAQARQPGWEAVVIANTLQLLVQLQRAISEKSAMPLKAEKPTLLENILSFLEEHLGERITLADVAKHSYVSESTVSQLFRQKMGVSFYRYLTQRRLIAAKTAIESGSLLEDVAMAVGFGDYSSFFRAFKQEFGISPRQYRKRMEN